MDAEDSCTNSYQEHYLTKNYCYCLMANVCT